MNCILKMNDYHYEKSMLETLIVGLKRLYNYLAEREIKNKLGRELPGKAETLNASVDDEESKQKAGVMKCLRDVFIIKQKQQAAKRLQVNSSFPLFRLPESVFIKYILCCMELKEICRLCLVSVKFNTMIKSNTFLLNYVKIQEATLFKVNMQAFGEGKRRLGLAREEQKGAEDDPEMQIETQKRIKAFLSAKLQESDEKAKILRNDVEVIKSLLGFEKSAKEEAIEQTKKLEEEFKVAKADTERKSQQLTQRVSALEAKAKEKSEEYENAKKEVEKLKALRVKLREVHKNLEKKHEELKEKNEEKDKVIKNLMEKFERGAAISAKHDPHVNKSMSRDESSSVTGTDESYFKDNK